MAVDGEKAVGCVAVRPLSASVCEMKRLYVRPAYRGTGLGKRLAETIIAEAAKLGYDLMRLDTLETLSEAMGLYRSLGFRQIGAYYHNPLQHVVYWEKPLAGE